MLYKKYAYILFVCLSISISYLLGEGAKNLLLIAVMAISPVMLISIKRRFDKTDRLLLLLLLFMLFSALYNHATFRFTTYIYSLSFVVSFMFLKTAVIMGYFRIPNMLIIIRTLIYAYAILLLIQQLCVVTGLPVINLYLISTENRFKLNSLAPEVSHLSIYLFFLMYSYLLIKEKVLSKRYDIKQAKMDKFVWLSYFWVMLTCQSTTAFFLCFTIFLRYVKPRTLIVYATFAVAVLTTVSFIFKDSVAFSRVGNLLKAISTFSINEINMVDHSAAYRFLPFFYLIDNFNLFDIQFWFGHGIDTAKGLFNMFMLNVSGDGSYDGTVNIGGFFGYIIDYGLICFLLLIYSLSIPLRYIKDKWFLFFVVFVNMFNGFNMQLFWQSIFLGYYISTLSKFKYDGNFNYHRYLQFRRNSSKLS